MQNFCVKISYFTNRKCLVFVPNIIKILTDVITIKKLNEYKKYLFALCRISTF